jgi:hypothetical protein
MKREVFEKKRSWPYFKALSQHSRGMTEQSHEITSVRIADLRAKIWTQDLPNTKQECQPLDHDDRYVDGG